MTDEELQAWALVVVTLEKGGRIPMATEVKGPILLPEILVTGNRFMIREKADHVSEAQASSVSGEVQVSGTERPIEKTGIIPKHVWG